MARPGVPRDNDDRAPTLFRLMFTRTCTLTFADGSTLTGSVTVDSPIIRVPVVWDGDVSRLTSREDGRASSVSLRFWFLSLAEDLGATFGQTDVGEYDLVDDPETLF